MKQILLIILTVLDLSVTPAKAQAEESVEKTAVTAAQFEMKLPYVTDTACRYAAAEGVNIREEPNTHSRIVGQTLQNTEFELVLDLDGWSMVTTCRGYAYIKSEYLSETPVSYSREDLYIMAHLLAGEAQCYPDEEQIYVGSVVLNRVAHKEFPNTIKDVVFQKGQYACTWDGNYDREPTEQNWKNARILLEHGSVLPSCVIYQSGGKQGKGVYLKTSYHYYCY
ncbi:cell wall hydrolase [Clostridium sp. chh4-2]|uniref:cell wall hydrolase n=1 Tax=Clostridium sp. chh4-2 TaxID=2067550 RepID=UPI000CCFC9FD|nr:cell wall hydrolase [Clostridium sp. chh4-2]PNV62812.1 cell wall hydrolase [Clostridium sp. chh4-2]